MKGKIIVIDGMDGTGKETQSKLLYEKLKKDNEKVALFSFPNYDDESSYFVKRYLEGYCRDIENPILHSMFYSIDRAITYNKKIKEKYDQGYIIILDRYYISNVLYQLHNYKDIQNKFIFCLSLCDIELGYLKLPKPDITIILASNEEVSNRLINNRYKDNNSKRDKNENIEFQRKVRNNIMDFLKLYNLSNNGIIDKLDFGYIKMIMIHDNEGKIYSIEDINDKIHKKVFKYI